MAATWRFTLTRLTNVRETVNVSLAMASKHTPRRTPRKRKRSEFETPVGKLLKSLNLS